MDRSDLQRVLSPGGMESEALRRFLRAKADEAKDQLAEPGRTGPEYDIIRGKIRAFIELDDDLTDPVTPA